MKGTFSTSAFTRCTTAMFAAFAIAGAAWADDDESDEGEIPFAEAQVLVQLNDADGDLGFHARIDGDAWKRLTIESPSGKTLLKVNLRGSLRRQGLTEFAFESAEPTFDVLPPSVFFDRFPEGEYEIEGVGVDGAEIESVSTLSHLIPAAPTNLSVSGVPAPPDCDGALPIVSDPIVIAWDPVFSSHAELGRPGDIEVESYEIAVEGETVDYSVNVPADQTELVLASGAIPPGEEVKYQILVREAEGNETSNESCFIAP